MSHRSTVVSPRFALRTSIAGLVLAAIVVLGVVRTGVGRAATITCPAAFTVEHDDRIANLSLPQGAYQVTVTNLSCPASAQLFAQFLDDWDGRLPGGWQTIAQGAGVGTFRNPGGQAFTVRHTTGSTTGDGLVCPQRFVLSQGNRIGPLVLGRGRYIIDRLGPLAPTCAQDVTLLKQFLTDFDGVLPNGWVLLPNDGTFVRGSVSYGFRLEPDPDPGTSGIRYPTSTTRCSATFRVLRDDRVGALSFPAGPYWVSVYAGTGITCAQASQLFASFLQRPAGTLPAPWVIDVATGSFRRGASSPYGFVAKPAFDVAR